MSTTSETRTTTWLNAAGLSSRLGISLTRAYQLMHSKSFPAIKLGGRYYVSSEAVDEWEKENRYRQIVLEN